jgi:hypothetical protein
MVVSGEDALSRNTQYGHRAPNVVVETDDRGKLNRDSLRPEHLGVCLDDVSLAHTQQADGSSRVGDVQRLIVVVEDENTVHLFVRPCSPKMKDPPRAMHAGGSRSLSPVAGWLRNY